MDIQVGEKEMWITQGHHQVFRQILINSHKSPQSESVQMCAVAFLLWPLCFITVTVGHLSHD